MRMNAVALGAVMSELCWPMIGKSWSCGSRMEPNLTLHIQTVGGDSFVHCRSVSLFIINYL